MFGRSGAPVVDIARVRIPALVQLLLQSCHLPLKSLDAVERIVEAGGLYRLQERQFMLGFLRVNFPFWLGVLLFRSPELRSLPGLPIGLLGGLLACLLLVPIGSKPYAVALVFVFFPLIVTVATCCKMTLHEAVICGWLGDLSYPIYLVHQPIFRGAQYELAGQLSPWALMGFATAASIACAIAALKLFDLPVREFLSFNNRAKPPLEGIPP